MLNPNLGPIHGTGGAEPVSVVTKCGVLRQKQTKAKDTAAFFVSSDQRRATPTAGDSVVGRVVGKPGESFAVDIGVARTAT